MENLKAFFTNLSKNTRTVGAPTVASSANLRSALRTRTTSQESDSAHTQSNEVRFENSQDERLSELDDANSQQDAEVKPQLVRLLDQIRNRTTETVNGQDSLDGVKRRLSKSLSNLELTTPRPNQDQINGKPSVGDNDPFNRTCSEGDSVSMQCPTPISRQLVPSTFKEPPPSQTVQDVAESKASNGHGDSVPDVELKPQSAPSFNHEELPTRGTKQKDDEPMHDPKRSQEEFEEIYLTNRNRLVIPYSDKRDWGQLPREPSAELDAPNIVLTTEGGQHKLIAKSGVFQTRPTPPGTFSVASWIGENDNRMKLALPPAFTALDVESCGFVPMGAIKSYWNKLGVPEVDNVLKTLGFDLTSKTILLSELTTSLETHLVTGLSTDGNDSVARLAVILTVLNEWRQSRSTVAGLLKEKEKLMRELQQLNMNAIADQSAAYIALERKYHEQLEALELEHAAESKLIRSHHAKQADTQRRNLVEQLDLNERLRTEVMQKSQENCELRAQLEHSKEQLLLTQSVIQQTHKDLVSASQTNEKLENQLEKMQYMKMEYEKFMECKTQLDDLVQRVQELPIPEDPSQPQTLQQALDVEKNQRLLVQAIHRVQERLSQMSQRKHDREEQQADMQKINRTLLEKIDALENKLIESREELLIMHQQNHNLQATVTELRAETDRLEQDGHQFELDRINLEKQCEELRKQAAHQAELLSRWQSEQPVEESKISERTMCRWRQERAALMEHQSDLEATLCSQAGQLTLLKRGLRSMKFCLQSQGSGDAVQQQLDELLEYCSDPTKTITTRSPQTVPIPKRRLTSVNAPLPSPSEGCDIRTTAHGQPKRYTSTATLNRL